MRFPGFSKDGCFFSVSFPLRFYKIHQFYGQLTISDAFVGAAEFVYRFNKFSSFSLPTALVPNGTKEYRLPGTASVPFGPAPLFSYGFPKMASIPAGRRRLDCRFWQSCSNRKPSSWTVLCQPCPLASSSAPVCQRYTKARWNGKPPVHRRAAAAQNNIGTYLCVCSSAGRLPIRDRKSVV